MRQIDDVLAEFGGDARRAVAALMHDLVMIVADYEATVSHGFVRAAPAPSATRKQA